MAQIHPLQSVPVGAVSPPEPARAGLSRQAKSKPTSKDRRHSIRKRAAMRHGQYAAIVLGGGLSPVGMLDGAGLIRVTPQGIFLYRSAR